MEARSGEGVEGLYLNRGRRERDGERQVLT
jgi:hypothetical protein